MEEPIVYMKQQNPEGLYIDKDGIRYDILTCHHTESKEQIQVGTKIEIIDGQEVEVPIYEMQVVINKGWDNFDSLEQAMEAYGVEIYQEPEPEEPEQEEVIQTPKPEVTGWEDVEGAGDPPQPEVIEEEPVEVEEDE